MSYTYDLSTNAGRVRLLIPDNKSDAFVFDDSEIDAFLVVEDGIRRAAALALETIASNEALVLKVVRLLDVSTDGAKVADALLKRAVLLRQQAEDDDMAVGGAFDIAEMIVDPFTRRDALLHRIWQA